MLAKDQIEKWLLDVIEMQIFKVRSALDDVIEALDDRNFKLAGEHQRQVDYWLSRIKNSQRLIDELE